MSPGVGVGLVTIWYRSGAAIDRFVAELRALDYPNVRPVFVVHALAPDELSRLRRLVPEALVLEPNANLGPAAGWNLAIARLLEEPAEVDLIGMWNVDTHLDPCCLGHLVQVLDSSPDVGAVQPILCEMDQPDRVQMFGGTLDRATGLASHDFRGAPYDTQLPALRDADYLDGGSMLVRADVLRQVGRFDQRLFMYAEDCDLSLRIHRAGLRTVAVRDARAWHASRAGLPPAYEVYYRTRNRFFLVRRYGGGPALRLTVLRGVSFDLPRGALFYLRRGRADLARAHALGLFHGVIGRFGKAGWVD